MPLDNRNRNRMIFDLPTETQLAIRLRALKSSTTPAQVICEAMQRTFAPDLEEAKLILAEQNPPPKPVGRKRQPA